jgi:phage shock protein A
MSRAPPAPFGTHTPRPMFDALRQAFREAVDNFRTELNRDAVPETADRLIRVMERELVEARLIVERLEKDLTETRRELASEQEKLEACLRREELARRIDDEETARIAREFAERHLQRKDLLDEKARLLQRELTDRGEELAGMTAQLKGAAAERSAMAARAGRTEAREQIRASDDLFAELDRMAERIGDTAAEADAAEAMSGMGGLEPDPEGGWNAGPPPPPSEEELEARLRILKERMGEDPG